MIKKPMKKKYVIVMKNIFKTADHKTLTFRLIFMTSWAINTLISQPFYGGLEAKRITKIVVFN